MLRQLEAALMFRRKFLVFIMIILVCSLGFFANVNRVSAASEAEARDAVYSARSMFVSNYLEVADAGKAGANISDLLVTLNKAGDLLSRADLALEKGDYNGTLSFAHESEQMLIGFGEEASAIRDAAAQKGYSDFLIYMVGSVLGTVVVVLASFLLWRVMKRRYADD